MLNWFWKWWSPEPVYSETGQRLWELLQKPEEWENKNLLQFQRGNLHLEGWIGLRTDTWFWQSAESVSVRLWDEEKWVNFLGLSKDDHTRLYRRLAEIAHSNCNKRVITEYEAGQRLMESYLKSETKQ